MNFCLTTMYTVHMYTVHCTVNYPWPYNFLADAELQPSSVEVGKTSLQILLLYMTTFSIIFN